MAVSRGDWPESGPWSCQRPRGSQGAAGGGAQGAVGREDPELAGADWTAVLSSPEGDSYQGCREKQRHRKNGNNSGDEECLKRDIKLHSQSRVPGQRAPADPCADRWAPCAWWAAGQWGGRPLAV